MGVCTGIRTCWHVPTLWLTKSLSISPVHVLNMWPYLWQSFCNTLDHKSLSWIRVISFKIVWCVVIAVLLLLTLDVGPKKYDRTFKYIEWYLHNKPSWSKKIILIGGIPHTHVSYKLLFHNDMTHHKYCVGICM